MFGFLTTSWLYFALLYKPITGKDYDEMENIFKEKAALLLLNMYHLNLNTLNQFIFQKGNRIGNEKY